MHRLEIEAIVREKNQVTIPRLVAERHNIEPGQRLIIVDQGQDDRFEVRVLPRRYGGLLAGVYGRSAEESLAYVRGERESWD